MRFHGSVAAILLLSVIFFSESSGVWLDIPFVKQEAKGCGAACISMVLQYWSRNNADVAQSVFDPQKIMQLLFSKQAGGIYAFDMQKYFEDHGFHAYVFEATRSDLEKHLQKGRPLIVCLDDDRKDNILHYVVVAGIDPDQEIVFINDPAQKKLMKIDWRAFEKSWNAMKNWTLLAVPGNTR